jgi:cation:H+ antiporter
MLTTLAFFVTGFAVVFFGFMKKRSKHMKVDTEVISRDIGFFLVVYSFAVSISFIPSQPLDLIRIIASILLVVSYGFYVYKTFTDEDEGGVGRLEELTFAKYFKVKNNLPVIITQVLIALAGIVIGADYFVNNMEALSEVLGVSTLILSLILTPIATELPEKFNSIIWVSKKKDTLAIGNITGALVFQSCFPVAFGVLYTQWHLEGVTLVSAAIAIASALANYIFLKVRKTLNPYMLMTGGLFYLIFIGYVFLS